MAVQIAVQLPVISAHAQDAATPGAVSKDAGSAFAPILAKKLAGSNGEADLLAQIASLLQSGMPMAAIANRIAAQLTGAISRAAGGGDETARSTLQRALAAKLAPPGTSPPQTPAAQAAALEGRLKDLLTALTSGKDSAGQTNDISGNLLDAKPAKDIPAQQKNSSAPAAQPADSVDVLAQTLLKNAAENAAALKAEASPQQTAAAQTAAPQAPQPDLLTRMIARAVNAQAARVTGAAQHAPAQLQPGRTTAALTQTQAAAVFQRFIGAASQDAGAHQHSQGEPSSGDAAPQPPAAPAAGPQLAAPGAAFATHLAQSASAPAPASGAQPYANVDPEAVVQQIVKGITIRSAGSSSEVQLHLQPEQLGDVSLKLSVSGNTIAASVVAQNPHVGQMLMANQHQLARALAEAGLTLGNFSVDVSGGNAGFRGNGSAPQRSLARISAPGAGESGDEEDWTQTGFGPPVLSSSGSLVLNYLA